MPAPEPLRFHLQEPGTSALSEVIVYLKRLFDGNYVNRQWSKLEIFIWLALSALAGWAAHHKLPLLFPNFFR
jgi:hypothetical protein